jgi:hypothetical protein
VSSSLTTNQKEKAMKVIKRGKMQKGWAMEFKCTGDGNGDGGCGATLLVEKGDLYLTHRYYFDGSEDTYTTFTCPCCRVQTDVDVPITITQSHSAWKRKKGK